jgi:hypothetical protein
VALDVEVRWTRVVDDESLWAATRVLYAWCDPGTSRVLYLGKADFRTVRQRFACHSKDGVWDHLEKRLGIDDVDVRVGDFITQTRLTKALLEDTETLLIKRLRPCCNVQCTRSRIQRPGLRVTCTGDWPERKLCFVDR